MPGISRPLPLPVHPRGCGERKNRGKTMPPEDGSSPRVRGTVVERAGRDADNRFIPAGAGNGQSVAGPGKGVAVHPRGCGERFQFNFVIGVDIGSSPRVRGTVVYGGPFCSPWRFIPAGAGNG